jgi:AcrR family transcriptional regulator
MITAAAEVNLAAVNYHFRSKEGLVAAVIDRRLVPLNEQRCQRLTDILARAEAKGVKPELPEVLLAFIEPTMLLPESAPGARNFVTLIGRAMADTEETARRIFLKHMGPAIHLFHQALAKSLPDIPTETLYWRVVFLIGTLSHTLRCIDQCPIPLPEAVPQDGRSLVKMLMPFVTAGMEAPL